MIYPCAQIASIFEATRTRKRAHHLKPKSPTPRHHHLATRPHTLPHDTTRTEHCIAPPPTKQSATLHAEPHTKSPHTFRHAGFFKECPTTDQCTTEAGTLPQWSSCASQGSARIRICASLRKMRCMMRIFSLRSTADNVLCSDWLRSSLINTPQAFSQSTTASQSCSWAACSITALLASIAL